MTPMWFGDLLQDLQPGDVFLVRGKGTLPVLIRFGQKIEDGKSGPYNHAGVIVDSYGVTFEALRKLDYYDLTDYSGQQILIARHFGMTAKRFDAGRKEMVNNKGQIYPAPRLFLHGIDMIRGHIWRKLTGRVLRWRFDSWSIHGDWPVCSELTSQFLCSAGLDPGFGCHWKGVSPDDLYDAIQKYRNELWHVVFEGKFTADHSA